MSAPDDPHGIRPEPLPEGRPEPRIPWDIKLGAREGSEYAGLTPYPTSGLPELPPEKSAIVEVVAGLVVGSLVGFFLGPRLDDRFGFLPVWATTTAIGGFAGRLTAAMTGKAGTFSAWNFLTALARVLFVMSFSFCLGPWGILAWAIGDSKKYEDER
jgi:hypothetical protein